MSLPAELLALIAADEDLRTRLAADGSLFAGYHAEMAALHSANARRLTELVARHGWPGHTLVGTAAADAAFRILQHAIGEPGIMRRLVRALADAVAAGCAEPRHLAMVEDRIAVLEGRPQRYGTQFDWDQTSPTMVPLPIADPAGVAARRAAVGLPAMVWRKEVAEHERAFAPRDWCTRQAEAEAWARSVGWRD